MKVPPWSHTRMWPSRTAVCMIHRSVWSSITSFASMWPSTHVSFHYPYVCWPSRTAVCVVDRRMWCLCYWSTVSLQDQNRLTFSHQFVYCVRGSSHSSHPVLHVMAPHQQWPSWTAMLAVCHFSQWPFWTMQICLDPVSFWPSYPQLIIRQAKMGRMLWPYISGNK